MLASVKRDEKETLYHLLETARCMVNGYGLPEPAPVTFTDDPDPVTVYADTIESIASEIARCRICPLGETRTCPVPGEGAAHPLVLVVGEGPGVDEDNSGYPFVGKAGKLLDKMLAAIDLSREKNVFIANVVKCHPPGNRDPNAETEVSRCLPYLDRQIAVLRPAIILVLGRIALQNLLNTAEGIGKLHGQFFSYRSIPLMPTYHPSALLRNETLKRPAWEDLKKLRAWLDSEGSATQYPSGNA